jgi:hypothetical protein
VKLPLLPGQLVVLGLFLSRQVVPLREKESRHTRVVNAGDVDLSKQEARVELTFLPRIWLMAALSFRVHSATTLALISFIYNMKAFRGFFTCGFFSSSFFTVTGDFLGRCTL